MLLALIALYVGFGTLCVLSLRKMPRVSEQTIEDLVEEMALQPEPLLQHEAPAWQVAERR